MELGHFHKHFTKNTRKNGPTEKHFGVVFLRDTLKTTFWMENLIQRWAQSGTSCSKITAFFSVFRIEQGKPLPPCSCAPVSEAKYVSVSLNISKYTWKCLNKLFWLSQGSEYAWLSYTFGRLLKMSWILNMS